MFAPLIAALLLTPSEPEYTATRVLNERNRLVGNVFFAGEDMLAGSLTEFFGLHGEKNHGKPFVWSQGKVYQLPLGKSKWGHVLAGNEHLLVGDVLLDDWNYKPATWTPDPKLGWAKARLRIFTSGPGRARVLGKEDEKWVQDYEGDIRCLRNGAWQSYSMGKFQMVGIDKLGRIFGNVYRAYGQGERLEKPRAAFFSPQIPTLRFLSEEGFILTAVNRGGDAVGFKGEKYMLPVVEGTRAVKWTGESMTFLFDVTKDKNGWTEPSKAQAINESGTVVGSWSESETTHAFVWKDGMRVSLLDAVIGVKLERAAAINDRGQIAAVAYSDNGSSLYLLSPK
jgi:probable HAF family extracellular repeat protein